MIILELLMVLFSYFWPSFICGLAIGIVKKMSELRAAIVHQLILWLIALIVGLKMVRPQTAFEMLLTLLISAAATWIGSLAISATHKVVGEKNRGQTK